MNLKVNNSHIHEVQATGSGISIGFSEIYGLISEIYRKVDYQTEIKSDKNVRISKTSEMILEFLDKKEDVTQLEISKSLFLKTPTVSLTLQKLEAEGYIKREQDKYDMRAVRVFLTEKGRVYNKNIKVLRAENNRELTKLLSEKDKKQIMKLLSALNDSIIIE